MITRETRRLLRMITAPLLVVDRQGKIVFGNSAMLEMVGLKDDDFVGQPLNDIALDGENKVSKMVALFSGSGQWLPGSLSFRNADGDTFEVPCKGAVIQNPGKDQPALVGIQIDHRLYFRELNDQIASLNREIRHRRQAEEHLRLTSFALDQAGDALYVVDDQAKILDVNDAACRLHARAAFATIRVGPRPEFFPRKVPGTVAGGGKARQDGH